MKKLFLVPLMALMTCVSVYAVEVNDLAGLQTALAAGGEITLTANITTGTKLVVSQANTTLIGNGFAIKSTDQYVLQISATNVSVKNIVLYAAKSNAGRGILLEANTSDIKFSLDNVTINATERGMDMMDADNITFTMTNSTVQLVPNGGAAQNATTGMPATDNYDKVTTSVNGSYSRGINIGRLTNSTIALENTTVQGFFYNINNIGGTMLNTKVVATNVTFKGRAAVNIWGDDGEYTCTDCAVTGINNFAGASESFASFVLNGQGTISKRNKLTINGGTIVSAYFDATGMANPNARQYLLRDLGQDNVVVINNASYTCTKEADAQGDAKGGVVEYASSSTDITINGGTYDCPSIVGGTYSDGEGNTGTITITGGDFNVNTVSPDMTNGDLFSTVEIQGGTFEITPIDPETGKPEVDPETGEVVIKDIGDFADPNNPANTLISDKGVETYENQDGSYTVVPAGTNDATKPVDPAVKTDLVWGTDVELTVKNVKLLPTQTLTLYSGVASANKLDLGQNTKVIIKDGAKLTIGEGGVALNNNGDKDPQIVVEAGGKLITHGQMYGSVTGNILIETSETKQGVLLFDPDMNTYGANHPNGVVELSSKGHHSTSPSKYIWQRFGIPTFDGNTTIRWDGTKTWIYEYEYGETDNWVKMYEGTAGVLPVADKIPFQCYNMTSEAAAAGKKYTFEGALMGNQDYDLGFVHGWNYFANSYTAPIQVRALLDDVKAKYGSNISATAYIYRSEDGWWDEVSIGRFELHEYFKNLLGEEYANENYPIAQTQINPMQAFVLYLFSGSAANGEISYKDNVYDPAIAAGAPRRRAAAANTSIEAAVLMSVSDGVTKDVATLIEGADFSEEFDNGYDAFKMINPASFNIYAIGVENKYGAIATNNLVGTQIAFDALTTGEYTLTFTGVMEADYAIKDLMTNEVVNIEAGKSYTFRANAGATGARFSIVKPAKLPTAISNTTATSKQTGVYSITGMYLGEKAVLSTLPKGVYVVDGKKVVK